MSSNKTTVVLDVSLDRTWTIMVDVNKYNGKIDWEEAVYLAKEKAADMIMAEIESQSFAEIVRDIKINERTELECLDRDDFTDVDWNCKKAVRQ